MVDRLSCGVPAQIYLNNDIVIREGEVSREMYFIKSGAVQVGQRCLRPLPCMLRVSVFAMLSLTPYCPCTVSKQPWAAGTHTTIPIYIPFLFFLALLAPTALRWENCNTMMRVIADASLVSRKFQ